MKPLRDRRPLSVQVYDQLVEALRKQGRPGDLIPPEIELANELGVSRTVLREALRLLEEDGFIERGVDPRRRQLARPSARPPSFNAPLEDMLHAAVPFDIQIVRSDELKPTSWSMALLELTDEATPLLYRECLFSVGGEPAVSALEIIPRTEDGMPPQLANGNGGGEAQTLLNALGPQFRSKCTATLWRLAAASSGGGSRKGFTRTRADHPVTSLTTVLSRHGKPVYLAKHLLRLDIVALSVGEPPNGFDPASADSP
ncbi:GntR family transcriptional regulator [Oricola sp.]|uniref:GntR family transcriptional regulator n=1 Tax=Oricola sp. TaxID=1979950 RepID=UPI0025E728AE|nr:GntR family transcriptional regulator [Oricola sp.]MCI5078645.1 GntR family transcriptional regulator [Oricola sp.]